MAGTDFSHLTTDELIKGIKALDLPNYIRSKACGIDVRETLAQMTEMTIQLGVNMGLSPDDALLWARKLQESVSQSEFDSWVATLLDGGPSIFMNTLSELQTTYPNGAAGVALVRETDPAKIYVWNGTSWEDFGDYQGIEIKDGSIISSKLSDGAVTKDKLAFNVLETTRSKNLYNKDTVTRERYITTTGALVANGKYNTSDYIEIEPMTDYSFNNNYFTLAYYDSNKQFISYSAYTSKQINSPSNTKYIRFSFLTALTDVFQLEKGHETTSYADYYTLPSSSINTVDIEQLSFATHSKNLFNKKTVTTNRYITATGTLVSGSGYNVTDFIPVEQKTYALNQLDFGKISCFDSDRQFIDSVDLIGGTFTPVPNTAFVRFTVANADLDNTQLEEGLFSTSYEDYEIRIPANKITGLSIPSGASEGVKRITVGASNSDFPTVSAALNSITDADKDNRYEIVVKRGTYIETFRTKHYIDIIGEDKYKTIIDYTGDVANWNDTSTVFAESNMTLSNLTLIGTDTKYPLHIDKSTGPWNMLVDNVVCIHKGSFTDTTKAGTPVGIGLYPYQNLRLKECTFIYDDVKGMQAFGASGVYFHNQADSVGTGYRKITIENCKISGVTYGYRPNAVGGTTSEQDNDAYIINNDITATHQEYYFGEEATDESWHIFRKGNEFTQG